jgi:hypothetical protein
MPNQQDFWKDFIDKRVQEALNPTLLRSAATSATFISNTTTSVSTSVSCTANTTTSTFSNVRRRFDKFSNNNDYEDVSEDESDTLVDTEVVVFEIKVADVAADLKRVGLRAS